MNLFELFVKVGVDDQASGALGKLTSGLGKGLVTAAKIGTAAVGVASAAISALVGSAIKSYAEYEQLVGGVETLFETSSDAVMRYAENAYRTSGLSANQYMATVTSFSASLIQSLGGNTEKAAEYADMAITDMSDNANKMGTDIALIQNAYQGFAKGNFTMLDNLKLGYGGTKTEMERLLKDAEKISGIKYDISSYADIVDAIHVVQTEMGITGTTAREAASTIEGSLGMMKASWENLVVGMADSEADIDTLISNFVESTATAAKNILPRISQALSGIGKVITELSPVIAEALPKLVEEVLPSLLEAGVSLVTSLVTGVISALPALGEALLSAVETILVTVFGVSEEKASAFSEGVRNAFAAIRDFFAGVVEQINTDGTQLNAIWTGLQEAFTFVKNALVTAFDAIKVGFSSVVEQINTDGTWLNEIWTGLQEAAQLFYEFLVGLWDSISMAFTWCVEQINTEGTVLNQIWETIQSYTEMVWTNIQTLISAAVEIVKGIITAFTAVLRGDWSAAWDAVKNIASTAFSAVTSVIGSLVEWISGFLGTMVEKGVELIGSLAEGIQNKFSELFTLVGGWVTDNIINPIGDKVGDVLNKGKEIIDNLKEGMKQAWEGLKTWFTGVWDALFTRKTTVTKNEDGSVNMKPSKTGLDYVPYDEFPALLHQGEAVLTAAEAERWRRYGLGDGSFAPMSAGITINQYIQSVPQTPADLASATESYFEQARWML